MMGNFRIQEEANRLVADLPTAPYSGCESSFKPHPSECSSYLMCNNGDYEERACPGGLHWGQMACTWPQDAGCEGSGNNEVGDSRPPEYPPQPPPPVHHEEDHDGHQDHDQGMDMDEDENEYEPSDVPDTGNKVRRAVFKNIMLYVIRVFLEIHRWCVTSQTGPGTGRSRASTPPTTLTPPSAPTSCTALLSSTLSASR